MHNLAVYWESLCQIYFLTKHYLLLAEELSDEFDTLLQPVKEHRDAFDHVARAYGMQFLDQKPSNGKKYQVDNMKKALGHAYRAFFDTADWLSYVCRKQIREYLSGKPAEQIRSMYPQYDNLKELIYTLPFEIAAIREEKDISDNPKVLISAVLKYRNCLDELIKHYYAIMSLDK